MPSGPSGGGRVRPVPTTLVAMPTVIKAADGADFLALVPHLLGYQPTESLVIVAFRGKRTCGALRFDLPTPAPIAALRRSVTAMLGMLCRIPSVDAIVPVVYTAASFAQTDGLPHAELIDVLSHRAEVTGLLVRDAFCVGADAWASALDPRTPAGGRPLAEIVESPVGPVADAEGLPADRNGLGAGTELPHLPLSLCEEVARVVAAIDVGCLGGTILERETFSLVELVEWLEVLLEAPVGELEANDFAVLGAIASRPFHRDIAILQFAFGREVGHRVAAAQLGGIDGGGDLGDADGEDSLLLFGTGPRPDPDRIEAAIVLVARTAAALPRSRRAGAFSMLAWFHWALGASSRAAVFIDQAVAVEPDHGLTDLIDRMVRGGRLPDWAFEVPLVDERDVRYAEIPLRA